MILGARFGRLDGFRSAGDPLNAAAAKEGESKLDDEF